jgi:hypothetical protein
MVTGIWLLIEMFRKNIWWGIGALFLTPVYWVFVILNWGVAKKPFLISLIAIPLITAPFFLDHDLQKTLTDAANASDASSRQGGNNTSGNSSDNKNTGDNKSSDDNKSNDDNKGSGDNNKDKDGVSTNKSGEGDYSSGDSDDGGKAPTKIDNGGAQTTIRQIKPLPIIQATRAAPTITKRNESGNGAPLQAVPLAPFAIALLEDSFSSPNTSWLAEPARMLFI